MSALHIEFYANVTSLWTEEDANSTSCEPVLGEDCLSRLYSQASFVNGYKCVTRSPIFFEVPECSATLGYSARIYTSALLDLHPNSSKITQGSQLSIESGGGLLGFGSGVVDGANATQTYMTATNRIQMLLFSAWVGEVGNT
ncbi:hypothetical protein LZ30DRAFT_693149 [Colletotrichum cereale]|nr:hypothetical protein LZ30DRAFT_693149 [Colletotrichum cereale]